MSRMMKCKCCNGSGLVPDRAFIKMQESIKAKALKKEGLTVRQIAARMGYKNPGSISYLLSKP